MATVRHPAFPEIVHEITDDRLADHLAKGWVDITPRPTEKAAKKAAKRTPPRKRR